MLHLIWSRYGADLGGSGWDGMGTWRRDTSEYTFVHGLPCSTLHRKSLAGTPCHPSWLYLHNSRKAKNNDGLFGGLVLPLRLFVWHLGYLFFPNSLPALNITESRHLPSDSPWWPRSMHLIFHPSFLGVGGEGTISSEVHILMQSLEPGNISDSQQAYLWNEGRNSRVKNCYRGGWHQGHWKYLLIWGVHFCDEHISLDVCYTSVF